MKQQYRITSTLLAVCAAALLASCSDDVSESLSWEIGEGTTLDYPEDYFAGGRLGTTSNNSSVAGCTTCHRPSWTTGSDDIQDPNRLFTNADMPRYPYQKIWPYTDMVQHRLFMKNDIRTGWCRTTPLWGRGLASKCGSGTERLHDCRARNVIEAIMWHGCTTEGGKSDAYESVLRFRQLSKEQRDQVVFFIESI